MKICVVGAGNIGLALACECSFIPDTEVCLYTKHPLDVSALVFKDVERDRTHTGMDIIWESDLSRALARADYVFCTYPSFLRKTFISESAPYYAPGCKLGFVPGYGGAEYHCQALIEKGVVIFGLQRVPFVARQENKKVSMLLSRKTELYVAALPREQTPAVCADIERLLDIHTNPLKTYLAVTLAPSNPLLHLTGLYTVFKEYKEGDFYDRPLRFYEEWDDTTSTLLFAYDEELQEICNRLTPLDLSEVVSLKIYYESPTPQAMTRKLKSIKAFEVVMVPLTEKDGRYYPDYQSRMFTEDFPYGIAIIKYFGILTGVKTPAIDTILAFYKEKTGICYFNPDDSFGKDSIDSGAPCNFGLTTKEDILQFYMQ